MTRSRKPRPFASGTTVAADKTKQEIERLVADHGGKQFFSGWKDDNTAVVGFRASDRIVRLELPLPPQPHRRGDDDEIRRRWRCLLLALKAQFTVVETGVKTFEQAFMADIVLPNDQTVYEAAHAALATMYQSGKMDGRLLGAASPAPGEYTSPPR